MKMLRMVFLAMMLAFATAASASDAHGDCCDGIECPIEQCLDMGCLPLTGQLLIGSRVPSLHFETAPHEVTVLKLRIPTTIKEVWTPPD
jgi:hypothetical protein